MRPHGFLPNSASSAWAGSFVGLVLGAIVLAAHMDLAWDIRALAEEAGRDPITLGAILIIYIALIATPFVPGAEIGLLLLALFGASIAIPVYLATVFALTLSFAFGQLMPKVRLPRIDRPIANRFEASQHLSRRTIAARSPFRWLAHLMRFRWLALIVLINMPGNMVLGGGGGIALAAGNSRTFTIWAFLFSVGVAVAPIPLAVLMADHIDAGPVIFHWLQNAIGTFR